MPGNFKNDDLRIIKTQKALMDSLLKLLKHRSFCKITVNDLCDQAQISRVAFYSHFQDKYHLLQCWLKTLKAGLSTKNGFEMFEEKANNFVKENSHLITNLIYGANDEVATIVCNFIFSLFEIPEERDEHGKLTERYIVLHNFCSGGVLNLLHWQISNAFPENVPPVNKHLCNILKLLLENKI